MTHPDKFLAEPGLDNKVTDPKFFGREDLLTAFIDSTSFLTAMAVEREYIVPVPGITGILAHLDRLDESIHEQEAVDDNLSKEIGKVLVMAEYKVAEKDIPRIILIFNESSSFLLGIDDGIPVSPNYLHANDALYRVAASHNAKVGAERQKIKDRDLTDQEKEYLQYIHLSRAEGAEALGITEASLIRKISSTRKRLGYQTAEELALHALNFGVDFDIEAPPALDNFSLIERQVAAKLNLTNGEIRQQLELSTKQLNTIIHSLYEKTGTDKRTKLFLIARMYNFEPTDEELQDDTPEPLRALTELERKVVSRMFLPTAEIVQELDANNTSVITNAIARAAQRLGVEGRIQLAVKLHELGYNFDIARPKKPLEQILDQRDFDIAKALGSKPYNKIGEDVGSDPAQVATRVHIIKERTGARTTTELALMVRVFDRSKVKPDYHNIRPREIRFFEAIGVDSMPMEDARDYLDIVTPRQAEFIEAYYFSDETPSWRQLGERFSVRREAAIQASSRGLAKIRSKLSREEFTDDD